MDNRYTLTIYVAAPGTPMIKNGEKSTSSVGHVYYGISNGKDKMGWGFAPTVSSPIWKGRVVEKEYDIYREPVLERTMEITKQQYDSLKAFGQNPEKYGFNPAVYNAFSHSCVDFLYAALKESKIYHKQVYGLIDHEGAIRVPRNIDEIKKIPNPVPDSKLNKTIERSLPKQDWIQENILSEMDISQPLEKNATDRDSINYGFAALLADNGKERDTALNSLFASDIGKNLQQQAEKAAFTLDRDQEQQRLAVERDQEQQRLAEAPAMRMRV